jgi:hypothetical protein
VNAWPFGYTALAASVGSANTVAPKLIGTPINNTSKEAMNSLGKGSITCQRGQLNNLGRPQADCARPCRARSSQGDASYWGVRRSARWALVMMFPCSSQQMVLADPEFRSNCEQRPRLEFMEATLVRRAQALIRNRHVSPVEVALASAFADQHPDLCLPTDDRDGAGC